MNDKDLWIELDQRIFEIRAKNYVQLMKNKIIPFIEDMIISGGYNRNDVDIYEYAHELFCNMKKSGKLNELNEVKEIV